MASQVSNPQMDLPITKRDLYRHEGAVSIYICLTHWCNLRCPYCYDHFEKIGISVDQAKHIVQEVAACNFAKPFYDLSGGELMGLPHWAELFEVFLATGHELQVNTNGTLINQKAITQFVDLSTRYPDKLFLSVSLDSHDPEINRKNRPGASSDNVYEGMRLLRENGIRFRGAITLTSRNKDTITDTVRFIVENYTREFIMGVLRPVFTMNADGIATLVPLAEVQEIKKKVLALQDEIGTFEMYHTLDKNGHAFCKAGLDRVNIEPNGDITSCYALQGKSNVVGNLFREPLRDIVERMHAFHLNRDPRYLLCEHQGHRWGEVPPELKLGLSMEKNEKGRPIIPLIQQ